MYQNQCISKSIQSDIERYRVPDNSLTESAITSNLVCWWFRDSKALALTEAGGQG